MEVRVKKIDLEIKGEEPLSQEDFVDLKHKIWKHFYDLGYFAGVHANGDLTGFIVNCDCGFNNKILLHKFYKDIEELMVKL